MHHCLYVAEIVDLIVQFSELSSSDGRQCSAVALARSNKAFYEPALDVRWRRLGTLKPLIACFPPDVCAPDEKGNYHFMRHPLSQDWSRFQHHARRVRMLHCSEDSLGIGATEYRILEMSRPTASLPLLPQLNKLYWDDFRVSVAPFLRLFIQPSLTILHTISISNPTVIATFLEDLATRAPFLRNLRVKSPRPNPSSILIGDALSKTFSSLRYLTEVSVRASLSEAHLMYLSTLPNLEVLYAPLDPQVNVTKLFSRLTEPVFPSLTNLDLTAGHVSHIIPFLQAVSSPGLHKVGVHLETRPTSHDMWEFFDVTSKHTSIREMNILIISLRSPDYGLVTSGDHLLMDDTLRPLLKLRKLSRIYMVQMPFNLSDRFLWDAAMSWSFLDSLTLGTMVRSRSSGITLEGLRPLANLCKRLRELAIAIDVTPHEMSTETDCSGRSPLEVLDIGCTSLGDKQRLVRFVADVFPCAQIRDMHGSLDRARRTAVAQLNSEVARTKERPDSHSQLTPSLLVPSFT